MPSSVCSMLPCAKKSARFRALLPIITAAPSQVHNYSQTHIMKGEGKSNLRKTYFQNITAMSIHSHTSVPLCYQIVSCENIKLIRPNITLKNNSIWKVKSYKKSPPLIIYKCSIQRQANKCDNRNGSLTFICAMFLT